MKVNEAMTKHVTIASPEQSISEAARLMAECDSGVLPVGENDRLVGMITDRDIAIRAVAKRLSPDTPVRDVIGQEVLYCYADETLEQVLGNMGEQKVRRLPVVDRAKRLVGILSLGDLARRAKASKAGEAVAAISEPGGAHAQTMH